MKKILQEHKDGCAVASLAMLLDIDYNKALAILHPKHKSRQKVAGNVLAITSALNSLNKKFVLHSNLGKLFISNFSKQVDIKSLKHPTLLCLYTCDLINVNHAVVWDPKTQKVLDPGRKRNLSVSFYQKRLTFAIELL
jgi:hypothetical protein